MTAVLKPNTLESFKEWLTKNISGVRNVELVEDPINPGNLMAEVEFNSSEIKDETLRARFDFPKWFFGGGGCRVRIYDEWERRPVFTHRM